MESVNKGTALITGASSGIGYHLTRLFAKDGYDLVLVARTAENLSRLSEELASEFSTRRITVVPKDLSIPNAAAEVYQETKKQGIDVNILVNDAGIGQRGFFWDIDFSKYQEIINLNILAVVQLTQLYLNDMRERNEGRILNLASIAAYQPTPMLAVYAASKAFILSLSDALINELKDTNITVTSLIPGPTDTDFFNKADMEHTVAASMADDAEKVAKEGYEALMKGEHHVVATAKVGAQAAISTVMPNELVSKMARKYMEEDKSK
ncbi:SDR family NAD(P)-dependent oxidoreductase [Paradesertivirga mongoliensis]|uniref:SDR family NAD(P)-dependent oxidoreductase n=1 Tax=Paradesertivirga mongoliensis TaxID=2100740 RepID=A0ABW4ZMB8_9SPHI|nr:SDR family oxidoreductase [Pedobacter mongoliensis]